MVPQQSQDGNAATSQTELDAKDESDLMPIDYQDTLTVFGSQQVKETSNTPYTDATQVSYLANFFHLLTELVQLITNETLIQFSKGFY